MRKLSVSLIMFGAIILGVGLINVPVVIKSATASACQCPEGCPCSHCDGKGSCNCKK